MQIHFTLLVDFNFKSFFTLIMIDHFSIRIVHMSGNFMIGNFDIFGVKVKLVQFRRIDYLIGCWLVVNIILSLLKVPIVCFNQLINFIARIYPFDYLTQLSEIWIHDIGAHPFGYQLSQHFLQICYWIAWNREILIARSFN